MGKLLGMTSLLTATAADPACAQSRSSDRARSPSTSGSTLQSVIDIGRSDLARAIRNFSRQTGREVGFSPKLVRRKVASPVTGRLDPDVALTRLLSGTGLAFHRLRGGYVLIAAPPIRLAETTTSAPVAVVEPDIIVIGTRLGAGDAIDIKRRALQSITALTDEAIRKLPDTSLADIVRRLPGLQLSVRAGGGIVTIRGLSQIEERINGRNLSSTVVRGFDIAALPSDIVSGIDVYKTPSASQIEGGIGGVIDFRTRRPFDIDGFEADATAKGFVGDRDGAVRPYASGHISGRINTAIGELGLLAGVSHQSQDIAQDLVRIDAFARQQTTAGDVIDAPVNVTKRYLRGAKTLTTGYASAQWRPSASLEFAGDLLYNRSALDFTNMSLLATLADASANGPFRRDAETSAVRTGYWIDAPITSSASRGTGAFQTYQGGFSVRYAAGPLTTLADVSRTTTRFDYGAPTLTLASVAPGIAYNADGSLPRFVLDGIDPASRSTWRFLTLGDFANRDASAETAYRLDAIYVLGGTIESLKAGGRFARRSVDHRLGIRNATAPTDLESVEGSDFVGLTDARLFGRAYPQSRWITPTGVALSTDRIGILKTSFGVDSNKPLADPALSYHADELATSGYVEATFGTLVVGHRVEGNVGVRYAATSLAIAEPNATQMTKRHYAHWLPSINLRVELDRNLYLRLAYSHQISRPAFNMLAPTAALDFVNGTGEAGNPGLKALAAEQYDAAVEYYPVEGGNIYAAAFYKQVSGFIRMQAAPELIGGRSFLISRPFNVDDRWIGGFETGFTQRFTGLPIPLAGLGMQASYTFIDSFRADNGAGFKVPLEQMSRHNYTLAGTYERGAVSAALTWIWRSRIVEVSRGDAFGRPLFRDPYGQLDANATVGLTPRISATVGAINLLQRRSTEYFQNTAFLNQIFVESRRIFVGLTIRSKPK